MKTAGSRIFLLPILMVVMPASCTNSPLPPLPPDKSPCPELFRDVLASKLQQQIPEIPPDPFLIFSEIGLSTTHETNARNNCIELNYAANQSGNETVCRSDSGCEANEPYCIGLCDIIEAAILNPHASYPASLALAFKQIRLGRPDRAKATLEPILGEDNVPETYTYIIASFQDTVDSLAGLLRVINDEQGENSE